MSDPGDKSDDLISELAKLMASSAAGGDAAVKPVARPAPLNPNATSPAPVRIPGMDAAPTATAAPPPVESPRAPATGSIRIPGMDQPAPVTTSAPVSKFDFGKAPAAPAMRPEPVLTPAPTASTTAPAPRVSTSPAPVAPVRLPSELKPVSENRSFGEAPAVRPAAPESTVTPPSEPDSGFKFDFGFDKQPESPPANDPIADLIAAELEADPSPTPAPAPTSDPVPREPRPFEPVATPVFRTQMTPAPAPVKPSLSPMPAASRQTYAAPIPLKPLTVSPRAQENDRFAISPGMGLNGRPMANQPLNPKPLPPEPEPSDFEESDPIAEIESLIGEAVRGELSPGPVRVQAPVDVEVEPEYAANPAPAPVVPPLTTQFAPRRSGLAEHNDDAAERAILAASADGDHDLGRLDGSLTDESPYRRLKVKPQSSSFMSGGMRQYVGMAVAGTLLLAAGLGLYWVLNMGRTTDPAVAPVLTADPTPIKVAPTPDVSAEAEPVRSPVLEQLGGTTVAPSTEQLVSTDETGGQDVARVVGTEADATEGGLANRKVRTVTVRPDGTIVPGDDAVAGAQELPIDRPNIPEIPNSTDETVNLLGDDTQVTVGDPITAAIDAATFETPDATAAAVLAAGGIIDPTKVPPVPAPRPDREAMALAATPEEVDLLPMEAAPAPVTSVSAGSAAAYVQLASSVSENDANAAIQNATARYGSLFGGNSLIVQRVDLGQKGIRYRVRLPASSLSEATRICNDIKASGGDCYATNS